MDERQKEENWSGVLRALLVVGFLLGGWLFLRLMGYWGGLGRASRGKLP
jgi:hypothetical protein